MKLISRLSVWFSLAAYAALAVASPLLTVPAGAQLAGNEAALGAELESIHSEAEGLQSPLLQEAAFRRRSRASRRHHHSHRPRRTPPPVRLEPSSDKFPVRGIDISGYQGEIDWSKVAAPPQKYDFVYMRASHGLDVDEFFEKNWKGASANGFRIGAYHFYDLCEDAEEQAQLFIQTAPPTPGMLPEVIDIETSDDCTKLPPKDEFLQSFKVFTQLLEKAYGIPPMLYVNGDVYKNYFAGDNVPNKIWFADPRQEPSLSDGRAWDFWQYAWKGSVPGINDPDHNIDFDVFHGSRAEFETAFPRSELAASH